MGSEKFGTSAFLPGFRRFDLALGDKLSVYCGLQTSEGFTLSSTPVLVTSSSAPVLVLRAQLNRQSVSFPPHKCS